MNSTLILTHLPNRTRWRPCWKPSCSFVSASPALANLRMIRSGRAESKGMTFTIIILCGYVAGAVAKLALAGTGHALPRVFWLYLLNTLSAGLNAALQWWLRERRGPSDSPRRTPQRTAL